MAQNVDTKDLHRIVGACIVYRKRTDGVYEYLILKRRDDLKVYPGLWTVPAGGMEPSDYEQMPTTSHNEWENNPLQDATRRETLEEANVEVGELEYLSDFAFIRPDGIPVFGVRFFACYVSGEPRHDPNDATDLRWIIAEEIEAYPFLGAVPAALYEVDKRLKART